MNSAVYNAHWIKGNVKNGIYEDDDDSVMIKHEVKSARSNWNIGKSAERFIILISLSVQNLLQITHSIQMGRERMSFASQSTMSISAQ